MELKLKRSVLLVTKKTVLFICTHNSCRSQMAEALLKEKYPTKYEAHSAGTQVTSINPTTIVILKEIGIDISEYRSKSIEGYLDREIDYVVTVCDSAKEACPIFPGGKKTIHKSFEDPSQLKGTPEEILNGFRAVRDQISSWIDQQFG